MTSGRYDPPRHDLPLYAVCPRCASDTTVDHAVCTNPNCEWPDPEPGRISIVRINLGARADSLLQQLREVGNAPSPDGVEHPRKHVAIPDWGGTAGLHIFRDKDVRVIATIDGAMQTLFGKVVRVAPSQAFVDLRVEGRVDDGGGIKRLPDWTIDEIREARRGEQHR